MSMIPGLLTSWARRLWHRASGLGVVFEEISNIVLPFENARGNIPNHPEEQREDGKSHRESGFRV